MISQATGRNRGNSIRRGFTLIETLLAIAITAMVGAGIATMMSVLGSDTSMQYDIRSVLVRSSAAQSRLSAYIAPARCVLTAEEGTLVLWLDDSRESGTIHATELRWITHDPVNARIYVDFIAFPDSWSEATRALADKEFTTTTNWLKVLSDFADRGYTIRAPLVDDVTHVVFNTFESIDLDARMVQSDLQMTTSGDPIRVTLCESIRIHHSPTP